MDQTEGWLQAAFAQNDGSWSQKTYGIEIPKNQKIRRELVCASTQQSKSSESVWGVVENSLQKTWKAGAHEKKMYHVGRTLCWLLKSDGEGNKSVTGRFNINRRVNAIENKAKLQVSSNYQDEVVSLVE